MTEHPESGYALADSLRERGDADGLVALLLSSDPYGRLAAAENLAEMKSPDALYDLRDPRTAAASRWLLRDYAHHQLCLARGDTMVGIAEGPEGRVPGGDEERAAPYMRLAPLFEGYGVRFVEWITQRLIALHAAEAIPELEATIKHVRPMDRYRLRRTITKLRRFERFASARA